RDAFGDRVHQRRLARAGGGDDERALAIADRRDEVDRAAGELVSTAGRLARLEEDLSLGVRRDERIEFGPNAQLSGRLLVHFTNLGDHGTAALVVADSGIDQIRAPQAVLAKQVRRDPRV